MPTNDPNPGGAGADAMPLFSQRLYEALLVSYGKILTKYDAFAQASILRDVGKEIIDYLNRHGFAFTETGEVADLAKLTDLFVRNGFVGKLEVQAAETGSNYIWHDLYGVDAYRELHEISDNPFLACPLNLCLYYLADKHGKSMRLLKKSFDNKNGVVESQYVVVEREPLKPGTVDPLVIENIRLYEIARDRADRLQKALDEIHTLRGILPICASCKKIRDEKGYWQQVEVYIAERTDADFSHGLCPVCMDKYMGALDAMCPACPPSPPKASAVVRPAPTEQK
ncbi:hypothetical protein [Lacunisphaera limnophila]|nr:hypothetical protein [Lacunisphaera limnophila]